jgi:hypothetical protein
MNQKTMEKVIVSPQEKAISQFNSLVDEFINNHEIGKKSTLLLTRPNLIPTVTATVSSLLYEEQVSVAEYQHTMRPDIETKTFLEIAKHKQEESKQKLQQCKSKLDKSGHPNFFESTVLGVTALYKKTIELGLNAQDLDLAFRNKVEEYKYQN